MHNGLPRCKALLFPLVRGRLEFFKKNHHRSKCHISESTPLTLQREEGKAIHHHAAARPSCFFFKAEGQFLPSAARWSQGPPLAVTKSATLPRAETPLHSRSVLNFSFRRWG